ncbi:hypothetical protein OXX79_001368 [Metschnikowia pulcherrima]
MPGDSKLRPYYDHDSFNAGYSVIFKPGVGLIDTATQKEITTSFTYGLAGNKANMLSGNLGLGGGGTGARASAAPRLDRVAPSADINYMNDLELSEYFDFNNLSELFKNLVWNFFKNYCRVLLSQPLDIVRLTLQVGRFDFSSDSAKNDSVQQKNEGRTRFGGTAMSASTSYDDSFYDDEEIDFFQPTQPPVLQTSQTPQKEKKRVEGLEKRHVKNPHKIHPVSQHTIDIMSAIASKDGPLALFRGVNASFIHYTLSHTIEAWITGFLSPFLNIPDPFFLDLTHSTEPAKSLWLSVSACILTGVILMPLDLIKVRSMITPFESTGPKIPASRRNSGPENPPGETLSTSESENDLPSTRHVDKQVNLRSVRDSLRHYPSRLFLNPPASITVLTILHQISTIVFRKSAPYFLFVRYNIDSYSSPNMFTVANLVLSITEFFIKLPVENLLRKEQVRFLLKPKSREEDRYRVVTIDNPDENLIVDYNGWDSNHSHPDQAEEQKAGLWKRIKYLGLFKGWRVGVLNVIGFWGYNIVKSTSVMTEERL